MKYPIKTIIVLCALIGCVILLLGFQHVQQVHREKQFLDIACSHLIGISRDIDNVLEFESSSNSDLRTKTLNLYEEIITFNDFEKQGKFFVSSKIPFADVSNLELIPNALCGELGDGYQEEPFWQDNALSDPEIQFLQTLQNDVDTMMSEVSDEYGEPIEHISIQKYAQAYGDFSMKWWKDDFRTESGFSPFSYLKIK